MSVDGSLRDIETLFGLTNVRETIKTQPILVNSLFFFHRRFFLLVGWNLAEMLKAAEVENRAEHYTSGKKLPPAKLWKCDGVDVGKAEVFCFPKHFIAQKQHDFFFASPPSYLDLRGKLALPARHIRLYNFELEEPIRKQVSAHAAVMEDLHTRGSAMCVLPPSDGKTDVAVKVAHDLGLMTAVLTHKDDLGVQFGERMRERTDDAMLKTTYLSGKTVKKQMTQKQLLEAEKCDLVAFSIQTMMRERDRASDKKKFSPSFLNRFGLLIIDECHHVSAEEFRKALEVFNPKYVLALSGTYKRKDGLELVLESYIGRPSFESVRVYTTNVFVMAHKLRYALPEELQEEIAKSKMVIQGQATGKVKNYAPLSIKIYCLNERIEQSMEILTQYVLFIRQHPEVQALLFTYYTDPLQLYYDAFLERFAGLNLSVGYLDGTKEMPGKNLAKKQQFLFSTFGKCGEGTNIPAVKFVFMLNSVNDPNQNISRGFREKSSLIPPIIVDFLDYHAWFASQYRKRETYYKSQKFIVCRFAPPTEAKKEPEGDENPRPKKDRTQTLHVEEIFTLLTDIYASDNTLKRTHEQMEEEEEVVVECPV